MGAPECVQEISRKAGTTIPCHSGGRGGEEAYYSPQQSQASWNVNLKARIPHEYNCVVETTRNENAEFFIQSTIQLTLNGGEF
jgi:hypothetical protein